MSYLKRTQRKTPPGARASEQNPAHLEGGGDVRPLMGLVHPAYTQRDRRLFRE